MDDLVKIALQEDLPHGDLTTDSLDLGSRWGYARLVAKEDLILSGSELFASVVSEVEPTTRIQWHFENGDLIIKGCHVCTIKGDLISLLKAERVALNFLGHLCGVATLTRCFSEKVEHTRTKILDTRKTLPGFREWEKAAVLHGKGFNHRKNLSDGVMLKENHIRVAGGLENAVKMLQKKGVGPIIVETTNLREVQMAVDLKVDRILLDNMSNELMTEVLKVIPSGIETEASGNMTLDRVQSVAELGVDFISVGSITHSAPCADLSLLFDWENS